MAPSNSPQSSKSRLFRNVKRSSKDPTFQSQSQSQSQYHPQFNAKANPPPDFLFPSSDPIHFNPQLNSKTYLDAINSLQDPALAIQHPSPSNPPAASSSKWNLRSGKTSERKNKSLSQLDNLIGGKSEHRQVGNRDGDGNAEQRAESQIRRSILLGELSDNLQGEYISNRPPFKSNSVPILPRGILSEQTLPYLDWALDAIRVQRMSNGEEWQEDSLNAGEEEQRYNHQDETSVEQESPSKDAEDNRGRGDERKVENISQTSYSGASLGHHKLPQETSISEFSKVEHQITRDRHPSEIASSNTNQPDPPAKDFNPQHIISTYLSHNLQSQPPEEVETIQFSPQFQGGSKMGRTDSADSRHSFYSATSSSARRNFRRLSEGTASLFRSPSGKDGDRKSPDDQASRREPLESSRQFPSNDRQGSNRFQSSSGADPPPAPRSNSRLRSLSSGLLNLVGMASQSGSSSSSAPLSPQEPTPRHYRSISDFQKTAPAGLVRKDSKSQMVLSMEQSWRNEELSQKMGNGIEPADEEEQERVLDSTFEDDDLDSENFHSTNSHQSHTSSFRSALGGLSRSASQLARRSGNTNPNNSPRQMFSEMRRSFSRESNPDSNPPGKKSVSRSGSVKDKVINPFIPSTDDASEVNPIVPAKSSRLLSFTGRAKKRKDSGTGLISASGSRQSQLSSLGSYNAFLPPTAESSFHGNTTVFHPSTSNQIEPTPLSKATALGSAAIDPPPLPPKSSARIEMPSSIDSYPARPFQISPDRIKEWAMLSSQQAEPVESPEIQQAQMESESEREIRIEMEEMARREKERFTSPPPQIQDFDFGPDLVAIGDEGELDTDWELRKLTRDLTIF